MKLLELFSGTKSISKAFQSRGHETFTVDNQAELEPEICADILTVTPQLILEQFGQPDVIWASPPCTCFSVASLGHHWTGGKQAYIPKTENAMMAKIIVQYTIWMIKVLKPKYFFIENPRGVLRKMEFMQEFDRYTVTYCQYGDKRMKPTDLWTNHPNPNFKPMCKNGDPCHEKAPRGSKTGTQGLKNARERGKIPQELCEHICLICEDVLQEKLKGA